MVQPPSSDRQRAHDTDDQPKPTGCVQVLVSDQGNRSVIAKMLRDHVAVETSSTIGDADLYLIEDRLVDEYGPELIDRVERSAPAFCPVVVLRRPQTRSADRARIESRPAWSAIVTDVVDAPVDRHLLVRRVESLLARRRQSVELVNHAQSLEAKEGQLRRFERALDSTGNAVVMTDTDGCIEYVNPAVEELTGYPEAAVLGESPRRFQPDGTADIFDQAWWRTLRDRNRWDGEIVLERADGTRRVADTSVTVIEGADSTIDGFVIVMTDVTDRINRAREVAQRERELDVLRQILTRYLRHNLRNDLNVILGYAQLIRNSRTESTDQMAWATNIVEATQRLLDRSETARLYSTLLDQDTPLEAYDLTAGLERAIDRVESAYPAVEFEVDLPESCSVLGRAGIDHALYGLIDNAARHNDSDTPCVSVRVTHDDATTIVIEDNGPGIPDLERSTLERGTETQLSHSQGVGLWLSKWVIDGAGGELTITSSAAGTQVTIEFPPPDQAAGSGLDAPTWKERDQRLQTVYNRMTDATIEVDASWTITSLDSRAEAIFNLAESTADTRSLWEVFAHAEDAPFADAFTTAMEGRSTQAVEAFEGGIGRWLEVHVYPEFHGGLTLYVRDTTDRHRREEALDAAQTRIELALDATDSTVWEWDVDADTVRTYPETHVGYDETMHTMADFYRGIHPEDRGRVRDALERTIETQSTYQVEYRVTGGDVRWLEDSGALQRDVNSNRRLVIGVTKDVTDRKHRERALRERLKELTAIHRITTTFQSTDTSIESVFHQILDVLPDGFGEPANTDVRITYDGMTVQTERFRSTEPLLTETFEVDDEATLRLDVSRRAAKTDETAFPPEERRLLHTLGQLTASYLERRTSLEALERTEDLLSNAERQGDVGAWEATGDDDVHLTDGARRILAVDESFEPTVSDVFAFVDPTDRDVLETSIERSLETGEAFDLDVRITTADGADRWVRIEGQPTREGEALLRGYVQDVTDYTRTVQDLDDSAEKLALALEASGMGMWELDLQSKASPIRSPRHDEIFGYDDPVADWGFDRFLEHVHPDDRERVESTFEAAFDSGTWSFECRIERADGTPRWIAAVGRFEFDEDGEPIRAIRTVEDITDQTVDRTRLEETNRRLEEFTGMVAHDLRTPLATAAGYLGLYAETGTEAHLEEAERALDRIDELITDLLALARHGRAEVDPEPVDLEALARETWEGMQTRDATLETEGGSLTADRSQVLTLLENLFFNAVGHGGSDVTVRVGPLDDGFYVEDTGIGIPPEDRERVFSHGYSTGYGGSGIGLTIVRRIAEAHGWAVTLTESADGGARFEFLP